MDGVGERHDQGERHAGNVGAAVRPRHRHDDEHHETGGRTREAVRSTLSGRSGALYPELLHASMSGDVTRSLLVPPFESHNFNRVVELGPLDRLPDVDTSGLCIVNRYCSFIIFHLDKTIF